MHTDDATYIINIKNTNMINAYLYFRDMFYHIMQLHSKFNSVHLNIECSVYRESCAFLIKKMGELV